MDLLVWFIFRWLTLSPYLRAAIPLDFSTYKHLSRKMWDLEVTQTESQLRACSLLRNMKYRFEKYFDRLRTELQRPSLDRKGKKTIFVTLPTHLFLLVTMAGYFLSTIAKLLSVQHQFNPHSLHVWSGEILTRWPYCIIWMSKFSTHHYERDLIHCYLQRYSIQRVQSWDVTSWQSSGVGSAVKTKLFL